MEALLSTEITRAELLLCKLIPYYFLGMLAMLLCMLVAVFILGVPFRGPLVILFFYHQPVFAGAPWEWGVISTITCNQFNAAEVALNAAFRLQLRCPGLFFDRRHAGDNPR